MGFCAGEVIVLLRSEVVEIVAWKKIRDGDTNQRCSADCQKTSMT